MMKNRAIPKSLTIPKNLAKPSLVTIADVDTKRQIVESYKKHAEFSYAWEKELERWKND